MKQSLIKEIQQEMAGVLNNAQRQKYFIKASCKLISVRIMQFALILPAK